MNQEGQGKNAPVQITEGTRRRVLVHPSSTSLSRLLNPSLQLKLLYMTDKSDYGDLRLNNGLSYSPSPLFDAQVYLWGLHTSRMRNATILVLKLKGVATEVIKNIVLAGIGTLIIADDEDVSGEDLGAGFFFREEDVGKKVR